MPPNAKSNKLQEGPPRRRPPGVLLLAVILLGISAVCLAFEVPLGIPGEWVTSYHTIFSGVGRVIWATAALAGFLLLAFVCDSFARPERRIARILSTAALTIAYGHALFSVVSCGPLREAEITVPAFEFNACGLFRNEAAAISDPVAYLRAFPETLARYSTDYAKTVRVNNNPPGTTMLFYASLKLAEKYPSLAKFACGVVFGWDFTPPNALYSASVIGAWILLAGAAIAFVPAYLVASRLAGGPSFFTAATAMLAGSVLLFNPGNDNFQITFFLWMAYLYLGGGKGRGALWGFGFGLVAGVAFFFSLATAVVVLVLVAWNLARWFAEGRMSPGRDMSFWLSAVCGLVAAFAGLYLALGYNSLASLVACYRNHAAFYEHFPRTYWKWALYNPFEFTLFMGGPLTATVAWAVATKPGLNGNAGIRGRSIRAAIVATLVVMLVLDATGKNASEVNRLWVFFMPLLAIPACVLIGASSGGRRTLVPLAFLQALNVILLRLYVDVWRSENWIQELQKYKGQ